MLEVPFVRLFFTSKKFKINESCAETILPTSVKLWEKNVARKRRSPGKLQFYFGIDAFLLIERWTTGKCWFGSEKPIACKWDSSRHKSSWSVAKIPSRLEGTSDSLVTSILGIHYSYLVRIQDDLVRRYYGLRCLLIILASKMIYASERV